MAHDPTQDDDVSPRRYTSHHAPGERALEAPQEPLPPPVQGAAPAPPAEPFGMLDLEEPPERYFVDELVVLPRDPFTLFVHWEVTEAGWNRARAELGGDGALTLRLEGTDHPLDWDHGRRYVRAPVAGARVSAAVGLVGAGGRFVPICHAPPVRVPWAEPAPAGPVEWMEVAPARTRGLRRERPEIVRRGATLPGGRTPRIPRFGEEPWRRGEPPTSPSRRGGSGDDDR